LKRLSKDSPGVLVPRDLLFASASGYDANISPEGALFQIRRIANARNIEAGVLVQLVKEHTQPKLWGFIGTDKVNVIELNKDLEKKMPR
jgi:K+-transporting ATPase ATPase C chain